jgi:cellulose synthase/poly-beta-1,6-N-acetylglucosamine synthase-like glycosyltransferase
VTDASQLTSSPAKRILGYFPLRYYAAAFGFFIILLSSVGSIQAVQERALSTMLNFVHIPAFISNSNLFVGQIPDSSKILLPIYAQLLFLGFFPAIALTSRANAKKRVQIVLFGLVCFSVFVVIDFLAIVAMYELQAIGDALALRIATAAVSILAGSLTIELALFSTITIPKPTRIKSIVNRNYTSEYVYLVIILAIASAILYSLINFLHIPAGSPIIDYVHLGLWFNLSTITTLAMFLSNIAYEVKRYFWKKQIMTVRHDSDYSTLIGRTNSNPFSVSFLIPAYNEERLIQRCIESIDEAAANYSGKTEIILINDGSTDASEFIADAAISKLKYASGRLFTIPNSGKGYALAFGLEKTSGSIIFRTDADSVIEKNCLEPLVRHFNDPTVGSVCGWVFPLPSKGIWWRTQNLLCAYYLYTKRGQELVDSIITQPGSSTAFRRDALLKAGGWADNIFGEDGEITNRIARLGYRGIFEGKSVVFSDHPDTLIGLMQQRARWGVAFYHSRGRNIHLAKEFHTPRSIVFLWNLISHGAGLGRSLIWSYLAASLLTGVLSFTSLSEQSSLNSILTKLIAIQLAIVTIQVGLYAYKLKKMARLGDIKYFPLIRLVNLILNVIVKPQVVDVLLAWSSRWKTYTNESFRDLRREVKRSVDPLYPDGEEKQENNRSAKIIAVGALIPSGDVQNEDNNEVSSLHEKMPHLKSNSEKGTATTTATLTERQNDSPNDAVA